MNAGEGPYALRLRLRLPPGRHIGADSRQVDLGSVGAGLEIRLMSSESGQDIAATSELSFHVVGFPSQQDAEAAVAKFEGALKRALLAAGIGADFGARTPRGFVTADGLRMIEERLGQPATQEYLGAHVYEVAEKPRYVAFSGSTRFSHNVDRFAEDFRSSITYGALSRPQLIAYELFNTAQVAASSADARFLMLFMALEALIEPRQRGPKACGLVDDMLELTRGRDGLADEERRSIMGSLRWLRQESIRQAGLRFCSGLEDFEVDGWKPAELYAECYTVRNALTHASDALPSWNHVSSLLAPLQRLVQRAFNSGPQP